MRRDLLALTDDDLVGYSNRGNVRRARAEVDAGALTVELNEADDGAIFARWSDNTVCTIPPNAPPSSWRCDCSAEPPCRHLLRTVMAYRAMHESTDEETSEDASIAPTSAAAPDVLAAASPIAEKLRAETQKLLDGGLLFELSRAPRTIARCHSLGTITRFPIAGDATYAICDCGHHAPCVHALAALAAFDRLPADADSGLIDTRTTPYPVPDDALAALAVWRDELIAIGLAGAPSILWDRARRLEETLRAAGLSWPAEAIADLAVLRDAYVARDARFDPVELARTVGELLCRDQAIRADTGATPQLFLRGSSTDRTIEIASAKLTGLGIGGKIRRGGVRLTAYFQDEDSGQTIGIVRDFADTPDTPRSFATLAHASVAKNITLHASGAGRLLVRGGKRTAGGAFSIGRAPSALHSQAFAWEKLRAPTLCENFAEVSVSLQTLPPVPLRPRRLGEDFRIVPIGEVAGVGFDPAQQATIAHLVDASGVHATLFHPYHSRGASGGDTLRHALSGGNVRFVAGRCRLTGAGVVIEPTALVVDENGARRLIQPWTDGPTMDTVTPDSSARHETVNDPPAAFLGDDLPQALSELLIRGVDDWNERDFSRWRETARHAHALGFSRIAADIEALPDASGSAARQIAVNRLLALAAFVS